MKVIGGTTTTLAIQQDFSSGCAGQQACIDTAIEGTKSFNAYVTFAGIVLAVPATILVAWLTTKFNTPRLLVISDFFCVVLYWLLIDYADKAAGWQFTIANLAVQTLDSSNFIFTTTMMMSKLKPESRGAILSLNMVSGSIGAILLMQMQSDVQAKYGEDYSAGAKEVYFNFFISLFVYWIILISYVSSKALCGKSEENENGTKDNSLELR